MLAPVGAASFAEALRWGAETYHALKQLLRDRGLNTALGDEGGFAPNLPSNEEAVKLLLAAIEAAGYRPGDGHRARARHRVDGVLHAGRRTARGRYTLAGEGKEYDVAEWTDVLAELLRPLPDRLDRGRHGRGRLGRVDRAHRATRRPRAARRRRQLRDQPRARSSRASTPARRTRSSSRSTRSARSPRRSTRCCSVRRHGYTSVMSHRSGETEDTTIADLAVATNCGMIKAGAPGAQRSGGQVQPAAPHRGGARWRTPRTSAAPPSRAAPTASAASDG